jgi:hypothetical protein
MADEGPFAVEALLLVPWPSTPRADGALLRRAAEAIGPLNGRPFAGSSPRAQAFLDGETTASRISLVHPDFGEDSAFHNAWLSLGVIPAADLEADVMMFSTHLGNPAGRINCQWTLTRDLVVRLISALEPAAACMSGRLVDRDEAVLPSEKALADGFPAKMPPFLYIGAPRLTAERREALGRLPAFQSQATGDGWTLVLVESLGERPSEDLLDAIGAVAGHAVRYLPPILPGAEI